MLRKNLISNYLGQGWVALLNLAFIPLYVNYLGIEAYGLIGFFALLQAWLGILDTGLMPTLSREMARFTAGSYSPQSIRDLLRSIETVAFYIALLIACVIGLGASWIATSWLQVESLPVEVVAQALVAMGLVIAVRLMESVYRSSIIGLQRQTLFNIVNSAMATIRGVGAVAVLEWVSASIEAFFIWQGLVSLVTLATLVAATYANLPHADRAGKFSFPRLESVGRFAAGMLTITLLSLLLMQVDKLILSSLLSLREYGYYTLAAVVAGAVYIVITPITQAFYPRFCEFYARNDQNALIIDYHLAAQLVSVFAGTAAIIVIFFAEIILILWTQDNELARRTATLLRLLMLGNFLNGLMWIPYQLQLAHGWTSLSIRVNLVAVAVIVPAIGWATPRHGAEGAAWVWAGLNFCYLTFGIHFMFRRILRTERWRWCRDDVLTPLLAGLFVALVINSIFRQFKGGFVLDLIQILSVSVCTLLASLYSAKSVREKLLTKLKVSGK